METRHYEPQSNPVQYTPYFTTTTTTVFYIYATQASTYVKISTFLITWITRPPAMLLIPEINKLPPGCTTRLHLTSKLLLTQNGYSLPMPLDKAAMLPVFSFFPTVLWISVN
ncbi:hypothetical protein E2C01_069297 [Portunus trituberculatus]|uniref:Uncharacterized protein n=1 Tax=Portunus trituberculatus TaxID=210409 RepID=A0A5B7I090_PORTR|nr:hypothetical protein [Portunus trituberculatus]